MSGTGCNSAAQTQAGVRPQPSARLPAQAAAPETGSLLDTSPSDQDESMQPHDSAPITEVSDRPTNPLSRSYIVPCVMKTIRMVEILRKEPAGLRVEDLRCMTGYPPSTIYRILRTLMAYQYAFRDNRGRYRLNDHVVIATDKSVGERTTGKLA